MSNDKNDEQMISAFKRLHQLKGSSQPNPMLTSTIMRSIRLLEVDPSASEDSLSHAFFLRFSIIILLFSVLIHTSASYAPSESEYAASSLLQFDPLDDTGVFDE